MILGFKILPQGQKLFFFFFLTNSFIAQDSLSFCIFCCNKMPWRKDAGTRYSRNVRWMEGHRHKVLQECLVEERTPAQGTPGTSNGGALELNKLDLRCMNLEACLWRGLLMVMFTENHVKYRKRRRRCGQLWPFFFFFFERKK
jgi:hypothetical protein